MWSENLEVGKFGELEKKIAMENLPKKIAMEVFFSRFVWANAILVVVMNHPYISSDEISYC